MGDVSEGWRGISPVCCCFEQAVPACVQGGRRHAAGLDHAATCLPTRLPLSIIVGLRRNNACTACMSIHMSYTVSTYLVPVFHRCIAAHGWLRTHRRVSLATLSNSITIIITPSPISSSHTSHAKNKAQIPPTAQAQPALPCPIRPTHETPLPSPSIRQKPNPNPETRAQTKTKTLLPRASLPAWPA